MDPSSRVKAALALGRPDRPPAASWGHTFRQEWSPKELAAVTVERQRRYGWDFVKLQPRATCFAEAFGAVYRPSGSPLQAPVLVEPAVREAADFRRLPAADPGAGPLDDQVEALRLVVDELGDEVPVIQTVFSPLSVAAFLSGWSKRRTARAVSEHPDLLGPALERIAGALAGFASRSVEAGAAGVFYAVSGYAAAGAMSRRDYEQLALELDRRILAALPGRAWFNVLHLCGSRIHFGLAAQLPVQAVSWSVHNLGNPSLARGRELAGRAVMGGLGQKTTLVHGSPAEVTGEVRAALAETGGAGILVAPGCSVPPQAPEENLRAMMGAAA